MPGKDSFCLYVYVFLANQQMFLGPGILDPCPLETDDCIFFLGIRILTWFILTMPVFLSQKSGCVLHTYTRQELIKN